MAARPISKLALQTEDFPFLDRIGDHDDGELLRFGAFESDGVAAVTTAVAHDNGFTLTLAWSEELAAGVEELLTLQAEFMPAAVLTLRVADDARTARLDMELPPALQYVFAKKLADKLED